MREQPDDRDPSLQRIAGLVIGGVLVILLALLFDASIPWAALLGLATVVVVLLLIELLRRRR